MSRPPEDRDREALRAVAAQARAALRDWTDATEHDPGVALLELLALLADELGTYADRAHGLHRGVVLDAVDPMMERRLLVRVPSVLGDQGAWALACLPVGAADDLPDVGDTVWVAFEGGDPSYPVWLGRPGRR